MFGIELTPDHPVPETVALAETAEEENFDAVLTSCHYNNRDPFVTLASIAGATSEVTIGPAAANPYTTHPVRIASQVATLDEASGDRALFGIGAGDRSTLANLGIDRERPLRRVLESFRVARELWAGETVSHDGTFRAREASLNYEARAIPTYVGAQGPEMLRMSAKHADGALVNASHPADLAWSAARIEEGLGERPGEYEEFDAAAFASVSVAADGERARNAARPPVAFIAGGAADPVLDRHDIDEGRAAEIGARIESGAFTEAFETVTPEMIEAFSISGTPETVEEKLERVLDHVDSVVCGSPLGPEKGEAISLLGAIRRRC